MKCCMVRPDFEEGAKVGQAWSEGNMQLPASSSATQLTKALTPRHARLRQQVLGQVTTHVREAHERGHGPNRRLHQRQSGAHICRGWTWCWGPGTGTDQGLAKAVALRDQGSAAWQG